MRQPISTIVILAILCSIWSLAAEEPVKATASEYEKLTPAFTKVDFENYVKRADAGEALAQDIVFFASFSGFGTTIDIETAQTHLERAFKSEAPLAILYKARNLNGFWLDERVRDRERAMQLLAKAEAFFKPLAEAGQPCAAAFEGMCRATSGDGKGAIAWWEKSAAAGCSIGQSELGECYMTGKYVGVDYPTSRALVEPAANAGYAPAQCVLGNIYFFGMGLGRREPEKAFEMRKRAAETGYPQAQFVYALTFHHGFGARVDYKEAVKGLEKAANNQWGPAIEWLTDFLEEGTGCAVNPREALNWNLRGAKWGKKYCINEISYEYLVSVGAPVDNTPALLKFVTERGEVGDRVAQETLGRYYSRGLGFERNGQEAVRWYEKAAKQGSIRSEFKIGGIYSSAADSIFSKLPGLKKDDQQSHKWYLLAAEHGYHEAFHELIEQFDKGMGCDQNFTESYKWKEKGSATGCAKCTKEWALALAYGNGCEADTTKGIEMLKKLLSQNNYSVARHLGRVYLYAMPHTPENKETGVQYLKIGISHGDGDAQRDLEEFQKKHGN